MNRQKENSKNFIKELFEFLKSRGQANLRIPLIGAKELDLYTLYNSVIKRGGAENVSNNKLWKEIVNEFDLPATCTSASFTLKNHYQKYLLAYEQKFFFKKDDSEMIKELGNLRGKRLKPEADFGLGKRAEPDSFAELPSQKVGANFSLQEALLVFYSDRVSHNDQVFYIKKKRVVPFSSEIKRILLAFESKSVPEIRFTLNSMLFYSCSKQSPFFIENYRVLYNELVNYFGFVIKSLASSRYFIWQKGSDGESSERDTKENAREPELNQRGDFERSELAWAHAKSQAPIAEAVGSADKVAASELLEQLKIILTIFRNLLLVKANETFISKNTQLLDCFYDCFLCNNEFEVNRLSLEIFGVISRYIILKEKHTEKERLFLDRVIACVNSDNEYEQGIENLHNLMMNQENEGVLETALPRFIAPLVKLLVYNYPEVVERVLEIICHFSDLKISTRVLLAKQKFFFARLVGIMAGNAAKNPEKLSRIAAIIISNVTITPASRVFLKPFEKSLFAIASANSDL